MKVVILAHPLFLKSESMPRVARLLCEGACAAGHDAVILRPTPYVYRLFGGTRLGKWAGYIDQYLIFPFKLVFWDFRTPRQTLFVLADQALGPWAPYIRRHKKVAHCMDLLALKSALGLVPENPTSFTGRLYQRYIRWGFRHCRNFISISKRTAVDLQNFGKINPEISQVVHLSLNYPYRPAPSKAISACLSSLGLRVSAGGYLLFVGGSQWYKNRRGLLTIYRLYAEAVENPLPLLCVSPKPEKELQAIIDSLPATAQVTFIQGVDNEALQALYSGARLLIFPSLAEGFGWPIVEAQACGCPVLTTDDSPMNEIAGPVARLLRPLLPDADVELWASEGLALVNQALSLDSEAHALERLAAVKWSARFSQGNDVAQYIEIYKKVLETA